MNTWAKLSIVLSCLAFTGGIIHTHTTGTLYPGLTGGLAVAGIVLLVTVLRTDANYDISLTFLITLGLLSRVYAFLFVSGLVRYDPGREAVKSQVVIATGGINELAGTFYTQAAGYNLIGAEAAIVSGLPVQDAYVIFPIAVALTLPVFAAVMADRISESKDGGFISASIVTLGGVAIQFSVAPIPMTIGSLFLASAILVLISNEVNYDLRTIILLVAFTVAAGITHKVPILLLTAIAGAFIVYSSAARFLDDSVSIRAGVFLFGFSVISLVLQWLYYTDYVTRALLLIFQTSSGVPGGGEAAGGILAASSGQGAPFRIPRLQRAVYLMYYFLPVTVGAIAGLWLFRSFRKDNIRFLQVVALITVGFSVPGIVIGSAPRFRRVYIYGTVFAATLIGVGVVSFRRSNFPGAKVASVAVVGLILISGPLSPIVAPDGPKKADRYLTEQEISGQLFVNEHISRTVYMDVFYQEKRANFSRAAAGPDYEQTGIPVWGYHRFGYLHDSLLNGSLAEMNYTYVALRTDVQIYRLLGGQYVLYWDPEGAMNRSYNRIYSNGEVAVYRE
ncbi:hypothetical protein ACOZ4N_11315 [Halorientalis pallida]|uniref:hypothetical protein n=1 Tax=Halorientalis pallida TaxID=2479928 RepID=UPI003C6FA385